MSHFANGRILSAPSRFITECKMNIQNCHSCKCCHVRCNINWVQDFNLMLYLNSHFLLAKYCKKCPILGLLISQVCQAPKSAMLNQITRFSWFGLSFLYSIKLLPWITADYLQWALYVKRKKSCLYENKKTN